MTWRQILEAGKGQLKAAGVAEYELDAWYLFEYAFGISRAHFYLCAKDEETASSEQRGVYETYLKRREAREPLQYILGEQEFMGLSFYVNRHVLIPRQDTEILVETVLSRHERKETSILDMCAGSGCIAVSLAALGGYFCIMGADISHEAVFTARKNAARLCGSGTVRFRESDLFSAFSAEERFDVIVSNPPYIESGEIDALEPEVSRFEPRTALDGAGDGLCFYRRLCADCTRHLNDGGHVYFEIGSRQGEAVLSLLEARGFTETEIIKDLTGKDRVVCAGWQTG